MSSALIRQALEFVDPEEHIKLKKRGKKRSRSAGQAVPHPYKSRSGKTNNTTNDNKVDQNIKKLLVLSEPAADPNIVEKIIQRAKKQKPLLENTEVKKDSAVYELIPNPKWFLLFCAVWGLFFIGGLMSFTLYHIYPYL